jgi:chemotaxis protein methyltransferase CheR
MINPPAAGAARAAIPAATVRVLARIAAEEGGLAIAEDKVDFLVARLAPQLCRLSLPDFEAYAAHLSQPDAGEARRRFIEALTTHTTCFFRETPQFDWLREAGLPAMLRSGIGRRGVLDVWSAACSSGQELYSALMLVASLADAGEGDLSYRGIGTDLSRAVLARAERAVYEREEISGIPLELRRRFLLSGRGNADLFRVSPEIRKRSRWQRANLVRSEDLSGIRADLAFLRNVLIYFDQQTRHRVLLNVVARIKPGGVLLTGHSESIDPARYGLAAVRPSVYRKSKEVRDGPTDPRPDRR